MRTILSASSVACLALTLGSAFLTGCGGAPEGPGTNPASTQPATGAAGTTGTGGTAATGGVGGGGGGGGGGGTVGGVSGVPAPTVNGPAWFLANGSAAIGNPTSSIDFNLLENLPTTDTPQGTQVTASLLVYNVSKKTSLQISSASIGGANRGDFSLDPTTMAQAVATVIPPNQSAFVSITVVFAPTAAGLRTGTINLVSNAGSAAFPISGTALPAGAILQASSPTATPAAGTNGFEVDVANGGSADLTTSYSFAGPGASSFALVLPQPVPGVRTNLSHCNYAGDTLSANGGCRLFYAPVAGAVGPLSASLVIQSNDPANPTTTIPVSLP